MTARAVARLLLLLAAAVAGTAVGQPPPGVIPSSAIGSDIGASAAPAPDPLGLVPRAGASTGPKTVVLRTGSGADDEAAASPPPVGRPFPPFLLPDDPIEGDLARTRPADAAPRSTRRPADSFPTGPPSAFA